MVFHFLQPNISWHNLATSISKLYLLQVWMSEWLNFQLPTVFAKSTMILRSRFLIIQIAKHYIKIYVNYSNGVEQLFICVPKGLTIYRTHGTQNKGYGCHSEAQKRNWSCGSHG